MTTAERGRSTHAEAQGAGDLRPLSFGQERLWFLDQFTPGNAAYNVPVARRLDGPLDDTALRRAFEAVAERHETLRAIFPSDEGQPLQRVLASATVPFEVVELDGRDTEARPVVAAKAAEPFDLATGPLLRVCLLRIGPTDHVLLVVVHHIVSDGWSLSVLLDEVGRLYSAFVEGTQPSLPPLELSYGEFAASQRETLSGELLDRQLGYWRRQLADAPTLELPLDHPRPGVATYAGAATPLSVPPAVVERVGKFARSERATPFMVLLAAFAGLLSRWCGQVDVVVGSPVAGRSRPELEGLIGFFVNTLVVRVDVAGDPSFRGLVGRVREATLGAFEHQDVPFERLVAELDVVRDPSRNPLFQVMLALQTAPAAELELPGLRVAPFPVDSTTTQVDLELHLTPVDGGLAGGLVFDRALFERGSVERLGASWVRLLTAAVHRPELRVSELPLLSARERRRLLGQAGPSLPARGTVHGLVEERVAAAGDRLAVLDGEERLSLRELNERANRLAWRLRRDGVGRGSVVGVCLPRSSELVAALLGVLKAGAAYLPLDPAYPEERLRFMVEDAGARVLVGPELLLELADEPAHDPPPLAVPEDLAYVLYTSGSTGRPKGVMLTHRSASSFLAWAVGELSPEELERTAFTTSVCFDLSIFELFAPLLAGGAVVVLEDALELTREHDVTLINTVPSAIRELAASQAIPPTVRAINLAGEALAWDLVDDVRRAAPGARIRNLYGPSETTTYSTIAELGAPEGRAPPIGRPVANTEAYVLDGSSEPVPVGVVGELWLGGLGLARGYNARPGLTADRFRPDPFSGRPGARLYRTGDSARWRADGSLEYLGRRDGQVKLRGFRIELGEVEARLRQHPLVREAAVAVREERLVAYVVGEAGPDLRAFLAERLPAFMVPAVFVQLEELPRTPNGKLDRGALPAPTASRTGEAYRAPRTETERELARLWAEALQLDRVGADDNFFELGGDSLRAARVAARTRALGVELPVRTLFEHPTVAELARWIDDRRLEAPRAGPSLRRSGDDGDAPLSFAQQRLWFLEELEPATGAYNIAVARRLSGRLDEAALERSFREVVARHESLRTALPSVGGVPAQRVTDASPPLRVVDLSRHPDPEAEARRLGGEESRAPFDLATAPLIRTTLLRLGPDDHALIVVVHHIVSDGWSLGVLLEEVATLYSAFVRGESSPLPDLELQYRDFARWQREALTDEALEGDLDFWRRELDGAQTLELPTDRPRPPVQSYEGGFHPLAVPPDLHRHVIELAKRESATPFMVLLAAFAGLLSRWCGQVDVVVGSPVAGRSRPELEGLIGFFVNTLVVRLDVAGDPSFRGLVGRVREATLAAFEHQDVPFERIVEELKVPRDRSRNPLFQVMFALQNTPSREVDLPRLTMSPFEIDASTTRFDLELHLAPEAEGGLTGGLVFARELFEAASVERLGASWARSLAAAVGRPDTRVSELPLLGKRERRWLVGQAGPAAPVEGTVHGLFQRQADDRPALLHRGERVSLQELNERANRLAWRLRREGVRRGSVVGVCLPRSIELVAALLGVLKAGAAYLPLDPGYPEERLRFMVEDSGARLLDRDGLADEPTHDPPPVAGPDDLAYLIYTSGSTGRPKGVMGTHLGAVNRFEWMWRAYPFAEAEHAVHRTPLSFVDSVWEIFGPLLQGVPATILDDDEVRDPDAFADALAACGATRVVLVPALLEALVDRADRLPKHPMVWSVSGEALPPALAERCEQALPNVRLVNLYGSTEVAGDATCDDPAAQSRSAVTIGRPIANTHAYVLDEQLEPVPVGVVGELWLGGVGLARGYHGSPGLTADRFRPDPFSSRRGARLYRTGDLARWRADGVLEYLGRRDGQVNLRGNRVELGEIEARLREHPLVLEAAVVVREDAPERRLVAYVVGEAGPALRSFLAERLPGFMVPAVFVELPELPRTPSGKLDRGALPAPSATRTTDGYRAPQTETERELARLWAEALQLDRVGADDNFFDLGGSSLLAVQLAARITESGLPIEHPLRCLYSTPTVAAMARAAEPASA